MFGLLGGLNPWVILAMAGMWLASVVGGYFHGVNHQKGLQAESDKQAILTMNKAKEARELKDRAKLVEYQKLDSEKQELYWRLQNEIAKATDGRICFANSNALSVWNAALGGDTGTVPKASAGVAKEAAGTGTVTDTEILANEVENGKRWKECRDTLNRLIDWHEGK